MKKDQKLEVDSKKRNFMVKFGKYAATVPIGMYILMTPKASACQSSGSSNRHHRHHRHRKLSYYQKFDWKH